MVDGKELKDLPIFDRDIVGTLARFLDASAMGSGGLTLVVDGMEARKVGVAPSAIQQVKLNQDPYTAESPRPGRGRIEVITKAGADKVQRVDGLHLPRRAAQRAQSVRRDCGHPSSGASTRACWVAPWQDGRRTSFLFTLDRREEDLQSIVFAEGPSAASTRSCRGLGRGLELSASLHASDGRVATRSRLRFTNEPDEHPQPGRGRHDPARVRRERTRRRGAGHRRGAQRADGRASSMNSGCWWDMRPARPSVSIPGGTSSSSMHLPAEEPRPTRAPPRTTSISPSRSRYVRGKHLVKAGIQIPDFSRRGFDDRSNREGTYTFSSLEDYALGRPLSFSRQQGDGALVFLQKVFGAFVQDQISVTDRLSITPGIRYDWQNIFTDNNNIAPRLSAAYAVDTRTAIRGRRRRLLRPRRGRTDPRSAALPRGSPASRHPAGSRVSRIRSAGAGVRGRRCAAS